MRTGTFSGQAAGPLHGGATLLYFCTEAIQHQTQVRQLSAGQGNSALTSLTRHGVSQQERQPLSTEMQSQPSPTEGVGTADIRAATGSLGWWEETTTGTDRHRRAPTAIRSGGS